MATPVLKFPVEVIVIHMRSRYREMELVIKTCLETQEVSTELWRNSAVKEGDNAYKLFLQQLKAALARNHFACRDTVSKYMHNFFGERIDVKYKATHALCDVEVLHEDEIANELENINSLQGCRVYRREDALFKLNNVNQEHTVHSRVVIC